MSDTDSKNKMGPITDPWGTPLVTLLQADFTPFITTLCRRSDRKPSIHCIRLPWKPKDFSLQISVHSPVQSFVQFVGVVFLAGVPDSGAVF